MSPKMAEEKKRYLDKRLAAYALAAAAALATSQKAGAAIQYTDIDPDAVLSNDGEVFDVQFAGETRFQIRFAKNIWTTKAFLSSQYYPSFGFIHTTSSSYYWGTVGGTWISHFTTNTFTNNRVGVFPATGNAFVGSAGYASALYAGNTISASRSFSNSGAASNMAQYSNQYWLSKGNFRGTSDRYLGLRFSIGSDTHYGWVHVSIPSDVSSATITGQAYEDIVGLGILAGEQDVSLAVTLSSISAVIVRDGVKLVWITESEEDHLGFVIERREIDAAGKPLNPWAEISGYKTNEDLRGTGNSSNQKEYTFTDVTAMKGVFYEYRLSDINLAGVTTMRSIVRVDQTTPEIPEAFVLDQNYPNPFNPETTIRFGVPEDSDVRVAIYNQVGQLVEVLVDRQMKAGYHTVKWDASDRSSGTYLCEFQSNGRREVKKLMLIR